MSPDDDGPDYWQAQIEQEQQEQEAADALQSYQSLYGSSQGISTMPVKESNHVVQESREKEEPAASGPYRTVGFGEDVWGA